MIHDNHRLIELGAYAFAGAAGVSLATAATTAALFAALISIALGLVRIYDRIKYGPRVDD